MKKLYILFVVLLVVGTITQVVVAQTISSRKVAPQDAAGYWEFWKVENVKYLGVTYGPWKTLKEVYGYAGQEYSFSSWIAWSHKISGSVMVAYSMLSATLGFDVTATGVVKVTISGKFEHDGQVIAFQIRPKYEEYEVTQRKYIHIDGQDYPTEEREKAWVKKFLLYQVRAKPLN
ncbi:hypothetical protein [Pyrococcus horikoshii]|uniref:Uncharacterized protein n=2 Tax=Pyrococcus horikoshii TaxID=53953 RepID=O59550_PYRHO|nr:hypothetical protein [Pyrococcus horikoshii]BAA30992.1 174aa long hypothetical protein [Pyrococcus horikoshii OT3]HII61758.1 hypothetical protein [Pyrococcus horikoshii]